MDWGSIDVLHVYGGEVVPGSSYQVHAIHTTCAVWIGSGWDFGIALNSVTGHWGDVRSLFQGDDPSAPQPDFKDVSAVVKKFTADPTAPIKAFAQLQPNTALPTRPVDFKDIAADVSAFTGTAYADLNGISGPCACPSAVTCRATACANDTQCSSGYCIDGFCTDACGRCSP